MNDFIKYAYYYDQFYGDKSYPGETDYLMRLFSKFTSMPIKKILDLGCGTGGHAIPLTQEGYDVTGVDRSEGMLESAREKCDRLGLKIDFINSDIRKLQLATQFDAAISMFAVMSYQIQNDDVLTVFNCTRSALHEGGLFIFDTWFGPAVLSQKPEERIKTIPVQDGEVIRIARPNLITEKNCVEVHYHVIHLSGDRILANFEETHPMRYFFVPEIRLFCHQTGFELAGVFPFLADEGTPTCDDWNVTWVLRAI